MMSQTCSTHSHNENVNYQIAEIQLQDSNQQKHLTGSIKQMQITRIGISHKNVYMHANREYIDGRKRLHHKVFMCDDQNKEQYLNLWTQKHKGVIQWEDEKTCNNVGGDRSTRSNYCDTTSLFLMTNIKKPRQLWQVATLTKFNKDMQINEIIRTRNCSKQKKSLTRANNCRFPETSTHECRCQRSQLLLPPFLFWKLQGRACRSCTLDSTTPLQVEKLC